MGKKSVEENDESGEKDKKLFTITYNADTVQTLQKRLICIETQSALTTHLRYKKNSAQLAM